MSLPDFHKLFGSEVNTVLLDGGLGTTLEECKGIRTTDTPLWSGQSLVGGNKEALVGAHLLFLQAGAKIISTATYQCSPSTFQSAGILDDQGALLLIRSAVTAAAEARCKYIGDPACSPSKRSDIAIALSLGPFGATLNPTQEFNGFYPPPYGPKEYTEGGVNRNSFRHEMDEAIAIKALADFHYDRLHTFASDETWDVLDCVAMESVPLVREVIAIREAFRRLHEYIRVNGKPFKPWWISFVFPDGVPVEEGVPIFEYVRSAIVSIPSDTDSVPLPVPSGIGINCVDIDHIGTAVQKVQRAVYDCWNLAPITATHDHTLRSPNEIPWLVLYPSGSNFDTLSQQWSKADNASWAKQLADLVARLQHSGETPWIFPGIIIGGCCKTGPEKILQLSQLLHEVT